MQTKKSIEAGRLLPPVVDALRFDFTEGTSEENKVARVAEWLNDVIKKGAVDFRQGVDRTSVILIAFSAVVPESSLEKIDDVNWSEYFAND